MKTIFGKNFEIYLDPPRCLKRFTQEKLRKAKKKRQIDSFAVFCSFD
jgi:hypothetical protein